MRALLDPLAKVEMREAAVFCEGSREELGEEFLNAVETAFEEIVQRPTMWRVIGGRFRRYLVHHFPYAVVYSIEDDFIYIVAIMHMKRKPDYWRDRI